MSHGSVPAVETKGLTRAFGKVNAVNGVDITVAPGTVYGLLGPNGAGKTTTVHILSTLLTPTSGEARVFGHDVVREADEVRRRVSLTGQLASVDDGLSGYENLVMLGRLIGFSKADAKARASQLLEGFELTDAATRVVGQYSGGMRRRLDIAASIITTPQLLFLDEPTTGLDPASRNEVWTIVRSLVGEGATVLLTTQYLEEADQLADRIAVIDRGKVIAEGPQAELKAELGAGTLQLRLRDAAERADAARVVAQFLPEPAQQDSDPALLSARVSDPDVVARALLALSASGIVVSEFSLGQPSLDEVFLALTGHTTDAETETETETEKESVA